MTYGGATYGGTAVGSTTIASLDVRIPHRTAALERREPSVTGEGAATATQPHRTVTLSRTAFTLIQIAAASHRTATLARESPTATGIGTVPVAAPHRPLSLSRPQARIGFASWLLAANEIETVTAETSTDTVLGVTARVETQRLLDALRDLKTNEGKLDVLTTDDGGFTALDRADGGNTYELIPPVRRLDLRQRQDVLVDAYEESLVSADVNEWDVDLELHRSENRTDTPAIAETPDAGEWGIETRLGEIATDRVSADVLGTGADGVERFELALTLTFEQAHAFEAALSRLGGTRVREIPDASNVVVDETDDDAATVTIDAPDGQDAIEDGEYVVLGWDGERINEAYQKYEVEVAKATST